MPQDHELLATGLSFRFGSRPVLRDVNLSVRPGEAVGVVGPNGSGKTTLIRLLSRALRPAGGAVRVAGRDIRSMSRRELARQVAVLPQSFELPESFTAREIVLMGRNPHVSLLRGESAADLAVVEEAMRRTETLQFRDRAAAELSGGERQRLLLARALAQEPAYLLLDEATSSLDLHFQVEFLRLVRAERSRGVGVLLVLHDLNLAARSCDRLVLLDGGAVLAAGTPAEVLTRDLLARVYGESVRLLQVPGTGLPVVLPAI
jgi:iron complex transport system ATP-binding protein